MKDSRNSNNSTGPTETTALRPTLKTFDDILPYVGDYGRYQWLLLLALLPYGVIYAFLYFSQFFISIIPAEHWCKIDELITANFTQEDRVQIAIPPSNEYPYYDRCHRKDLNFTKILQSGDNPRSYQLWNNRTVECSSWEYNYTQIPYPSIGTEIGYAGKNTSYQQPKRFSSADRSAAVS